MINNQVGQLNKWNDLLSDENKPSEAETGFCEGVLDLDISRISLEMNEAYSNCPSSDAADSIRGSLGCDRSTPPPWWLLTGSHHGDTSRAVGCTERCALKRNLSHYRVSCGKQDTNMAAVSNQVREGDGSPLKRWNRRREAVTLVTEQCSSGEPWSWCPCGCPLPRKAHPTGPCSPGCDVACQLVQQGAL